MLLPGDEGHTHQRRKETKHEGRNPATKRKILGHTKKEDIKFREMELTEFQDKN